MSGRPEGGGGGGDDRNAGALAFARISAAIVEGRLDFGEPLSEGGLSTALGIGKAPVRAAIVELRNHHLVEIVARAGTYVVSPGADDIRALCRHRFALEAMAVQAAVERDAEGLGATLDAIVAAMDAAAAAGDAAAGKRLDGDWHWAFVAHAANPFLEEAYRRIAPLVAALRWRFMDTAIYRTRAHDEHRRVADLLAAGQVARAVATLRAHIARTERYQAGILWSEGRAPRRRYRTRDYAALLGIDPAADRLPGGVRAGGRDETRAFDSPEIRLSPIRHGLDL